MLVNKKLNDFFLNNNMKEEIVWINSLNIYQEGNSLKIYFPHKFFANWFFTYKKKLFEAVSKKCLRNKSINFLYIGYSTDDLKKYLDESSEENNITDDILFDVINSKEYKDKNFTNFIYNINNDFELKTLITISENDPCSLYSPVLICGDPGVGKTHLLVAISKKMIERNEKDILIVPSKKINAISKIIYNESFLSKYQCVMIDGIDSLVDSLDGQALLIDLLDICYDNIQLFFTCCGNKDIIDLLNYRLRSRINRGLILYIKAADFNVRINFIKMYCRQNELEFNSKQIIFLAQNSETIRDIYGLFLRIKTLLEIESQNIENINLQKIIDTKDIDINTIIRYKEIIQLVAEHFNITVDDIMGHKRIPSISIPRQISMYICRTTLGLELKEIGRIFGGKDHSTILYSINRIAKFIKHDHKIASIVKDINNSL